MAIDQVRAELAGMLAFSKESMKGVDLGARSVAAGRVAGLEDALALIDRLLYEQEAESLRILSQAKEHRPN